MFTLLQINVDANNGSNGSIARAIGDKVHALGWKSYIAYGRLSVPSETSTLIKIGNKINVYEHVLESRMFDNHCLSSRYCTRKLINKIDQIAPDIIHLHNIHGYFINFKILFEYIKKKNIPVVWTLHDCWSFTGHCAHFENYGCFKWKEGCFDCKFHKSYPQSWLIDRSKDNYILKKRLFTSIPNLTIVPVSDWLSNYLKESYFCNTKIITIKNGINLNVFYPREKNKSELGLDSNKFTILGISNVWTNDKGLQEFIELSKDERYQIVMIGVDNNVKKILPSNIIAINRTTNQSQLAEYYSVADILVNPTYADTYPTINLESLSCGTPLITYRTGGSPETIDENTGIVVEKGDKHSLYQAVETMYNETIENRINRKQQCIKRAKELFNKEKCFDRYIELYEKILQNKNNDKL